MTDALELEFAAAGPPATRFVMSPLWELLASIRVLQSPPVAPAHRDWARNVTRRLDRRSGDLTILFGLLAAGSSYVPGFLLVPPLTPVPDLTADLVGLRGTSTEQVRADLDLLSWVLTTRGAGGVPARAPRRRAGPLPAPLRDLYDEPQAGLAELTRQIESYWELAIAPRWGRLRALLAADLLHRGRRSGPDLAFEDLHPAVSWHGRSLRLEHSTPGGPRAVEDGDLLLMPSAFATAEPWPLNVPPHHPRLTYPARGVDRFWDHGEVLPTGGLAGVLGGSRARLLAELQAPASTSTLAARMDLTTGGISQHLTALRAAGLISSHRSGHSVLHARTETAEALIANARDTTPPTAQP